MSIEMRKRTNSSGKYPWIRKSSMTRFDLRNTTCINLERAYCFRTKSSIKTRKVEKIQIKQTREILLITRMWRIHKISRKEDLYRPRMRGSWVGRFDSINISQLKIAEVTRFDEGVQAIGTSGRIESIASKLNGFHFQVSSVLNNTKILEKIEGFIVQSKKGAFPSDTREKKTNIQNRYFKQKINI